MRKAMLYAHKDKLPKMIFDGTMMFTTARLTQDDKPLKLASSTNDGVAVEIRSTGSACPVQLFNIVLLQVLILAFAR